MKRNPQRLREKEFDVLVIGGGITGACTAREAAFRGLTTALIEKRDFCGATSANSLKIIHGGLRYLQQVDLFRTRESARERRNMMRMAPHLVDPLNCIMPTFPSLMKSRPAMFAGLLLNDILSCDRNREVLPEKHIPMGQVVSLDECRRRIPGLDERKVTGGAVWYDALAYDTERIVIGIIRSAVLHGTTAVNYVEMRTFLKKDKAITGVLARDRLTGEEFEIRARLVVNGAGPWANEILACAEAPLTACPGGLAMGMNVVLRRQLIPQYAVGLPTSRDAGTPGRLLFFVPWKGLTMVGTYYREHQGPADSLKIMDADIEAFLRELNLAYPVAHLKREDISFCHAGLLPATRFRPGALEPDLAPHYRLIDHQHRDGIQGIITAQGVKYTTGRHVAEKAIALACRKLGRTAPAAHSGEKPIPGGDISSFADLRSEATNASQGKLPESVIARLLRNYGTEHSILRRMGTGPDVLQPLGGDTEVTEAEVLYGIREEMAQTLSDILFRRTGLGSTGLPGEATLRACARIMAKECGWDDARIEKEIASVQSAQFPG